MRDWLWVARKAKRSTGHELDDLDDWAYFLAIKGHHRARRMMRKDWGRLPVEWQDSLLDAGVFIPARGHSNGRLIECVLLGGKGSGAARAELVARRDDLEDDEYEVLQHARVVGFIRDRPESVE